MPWLIFSVALVLVYVAQKTFVAFTAQPLDLFLVLALVWGLTAPVYDARIAAFLIGLSQDLGSDGRLGVHAFALGLTGLLVTQLREMVNRQLWWGSWLIGFLAALPAYVLLVLHLRFLDGQRTLSWGSMLSGALWTALLGALLAALAAHVPSLLGRPRRFHYPPSRR